MSSASEDDLPIQRTKDAPRREIRSQTLELTP